MNSLHPSTFYLMIEALAVLSIVIGIVAFVLIKRHLRRKALLIKLVDNITHNSEKRQQELQKLCPDHADQILKQETQLYQFMIRLITAKEPETLLEIDREIESYTNALLENSAHLSSEQSGSDHQNEQVAEATSALKEDIAQIKNEIGELSNKNDAVLSTLQNLSLAASTASSSEQTSPENTVAEESIVDAEDTVSDEVPETETSEADETAVNLDDIIDIAEEAQPTAASGEDDLTDIDALIDDAQPDTNTASDSDNIDDLLDQTQSTPEEAKIEEIPDDLLNNDEVSVNDAATDIDALFDAVAKENVEKSSEPA